MIKNRFLALAMAAAMTLAAAVPAFANTTRISLTVAPKNPYTMTVPADTTLNSDGTATQLTNGIEITDGELAEGKKLTVTASSANSWKMKAGDKEIGYALYSDAGKTETKTWEFTKDEANDGATKAVYAKADAADLAAADSGEYSDVITFTAEVKDANIAVQSVSLSQASLSLEANNSSRLTATVTPANATDATVTWTSDDTDVATVSSAGSSVWVKAVAAGSATITATAGGKSATCTVTVTPKVNKVDFWIGADWYQVNENTTWDSFAANAGSGAVEIRDGGVYKKDTNNRIKNSANGYVLPSDKIVRDNYSV